MARSKTFGTIILINAGVRVCSQCGQAEPDAPKTCPEAGSHDWSF